MCTHCTEPILLLMAIAQATLTYSEYACNSILVQGVRESLKDIPQHMLWLQHIEVCWNFQLTCPTCREQLIHPVESLPVSGYFLPVAIQL